MALRLERDSPCREHLPRFFRELFRMLVPLIELRLGVGQNRLPIDDVLDGFVTVDLDFNFHPLIAVISLGGRIDAVRRKQLSFHDDVCPWCAKVRSRSLLLSVASQ